jgi:membrane associated rhomboid family serine protease
MEGDIDSETKFIWKIIFHVLMTPITLILVLFKKKEPKDLLQPFRDIIQFIFAAKFTITIIIINIFIFIISLFFTDSLIMALINYPSNLITLRLHTLLTSGFLHANAGHLIGNMIGIFIFGRVVERKMGIGKTAVVYFGALILSNIFSSLIHLFILGDNIGGLGASGALMGLVATAILRDPFYLTHEFGFPIPVMVVGWLAILADLSGVLNPVEDGIGHFAHIGGFLSIALLAFILGGEEKAKLKKGLMINIISFIVIALLLFYFTRNLSF